MTSHAQDDAGSLVPFKYELYPLTAIQPRGWIQHEINLSGQGLGGHLFYFYRFVKGSTWLGGTWEYTGLNEAAPYWYNYIVPLAFSIDEQSDQELRKRLLDQAQYFLDYTLEHQAEDGWLGPETTKQTRGIWARCLLLQGLINHAQADPKQYDRIIKALLKFVRLVHTMLSDNLTGYLPGEDDKFDLQWFGVARAHELSLNLQWLYEYVGDKADRKQMWEIMEMLWHGARKAGRDWTQFFTEDGFAKEPPVREGKARGVNFMHGVNVAQGLRYPAQLYRMHPISELKQQVYDAVDMVRKYHGTASGGFSSDEFIGGVEPNRGIEVCCNVEYMFSLAFFHRLFGDSDWADKVEFNAFNAFPAGVSEDWWSHEYVTQVNQPWASEYDVHPGEKTPWYDTCRYANVFGLEPEFPCCTVNHPTAFPKLAMNTFVNFSNGQLGEQAGTLHAYLVAGHLRYEDREIECDTTYPFDPLLLKYTITAKSPFLLAVRIPGWCDKTPEVTMATDLHVSIDMKHRLIRISIPACTKLHIEISLTASVHVTKHADSSVSIERGPLLYALPIEFETSSTLPRNYLDQESDCYEVANNTEHDWMAHVRDNSLRPTTPWAVVIDTSKGIKVNEVQLAASTTQSVWSSQSKTTYLEVRAQEVEWPLEKGTAAPPSRLTEKAIRKGSPFTAKLVPYGSAKLHMAQFPNFVL